MSLRRIVAGTVATALLTFAALPSPASAATTAVPQIPTCDPVVYCQPVNGNIHDSTGLGTVAVVPGDPSPSAPGIWLGNTVTGEFCWGDYNQFIVDTDHDLMDDNCEFQLARAFAPVLEINPSDGCAGGEPYWAAKYFQKGTGWGQFVRIAYMPAYYSDCGILGHDGDSEFIMIGLDFNAATRHWQVREAYLSAHAGTPTNSSRYIRIPSDLSYPTRNLGYPLIWVAKSKHANYKTQSDCNAGAAHTDTCNGNVAMGRMLVYANRNVGSRFVDAFPSGVLSQNPAKAGNPKRESFYTPSAFQGWHDSSTDNTKPYNNFLMSYVFECYDYTYTFQGTCYWGPGPNAPAVTFLRGHVEGPTSIVTGQSNSWTSFVTGGIRPYLATWAIKYASDSTATTVGTSTGAGTAYSAGGWTGTIIRCENFTLTMTVTDTTGQSWYNNYPVTVTCPPPPPPLSLYLSGPSLVTAKGTYAYTAVTSGFTSPTYTWSERFCADTDGTSCGAWSTINGDSVDNRVLSPDCSGTGQNTYWSQVLVTNSDGRSLTSQLITALCQGGGDPL